jgi:hypothetical protein
LISELFIPTLGGKSSLSESDRNLTEIKDYGKFLSKTLEVLRATLASVKKRATQEN